MSEPTRTLLFCAAALLDQSRTVDRLSRPLTVAALIGILVCPAIMARPPWMVVGFAMLVALAGLGEAYLAIRTGFDAALFHQVASAAEAPDFVETDAALTQLGLMTATKLGRPAETRVARTTRLFGFQILALAAQVLSVLVGGGVALVWR